MTSPFDWRGQPPRIDLRDVERARKTSYQQTNVINKRRAAGVEPTPVRLPGSRDDGPQKFVALMPEMPKYRKPPKSRKP